MFKEIVSQLSYSPAMVAKLAAYARRIRATRRLYGYSIAVLALLVILQLLVIIFPAYPLITTSDETSILAHLEAFMQQLPHVGVWAPLWTYVGILSITILLYMTTALREREIRLIRKQLNSGGTL